MPTTVTDRLNETSKQRKRKASSDPIIAAATADIPNAKVTTLSSAKPSPTRKVTGGKKAPSTGKIKPKVEGSVKASNRLTNEWPSESGRDVKVKDQVKLPDGTVITCVGRWSKRLKDGGLVPMITGTTEDGTRRNIPAADCKHVKK